MSTVLIVDDEPVVRETLSIALRRAGYEIIEACNGREAIQCVHFRAPDLILLDLMMPDINGWDVLRTLKQEGFKIPIIVISAHPRPNVKELLEYGATCFLPKPFSLPELISVVDQYVKEGPQEARRDTQVKRTGEGMGVALNVALDPLGE